MSQANYCKPLLCYQFPSDVPYRKLRLNVGAFGYVGEWVKDIRDWNVDCPKTFACLEGGGFRIMYILRMRDKMWSTSFQKKMKPSVLQKSSTWNVDFFIPLKLVLAIKGPSVTLFFVQSGPPHQGRAYLDSHLTPNQVCKSSQVPKADWGIVNHQTGVDEMESETDLRGGSQFLNLSQRR